MKEEQSGSEDLGTKASSSRIEGDTVRFSSAWADFCGGISQSAADAFQAFRDELSKDNITEISISNGYIKAIVAGNTRFFDGLAKTSDKVYADLTSNRDVNQEIAAAIDYERLARLVADEMRKQQK